MYKYSSLLIILMTCLFQSKAQFPLINAEERFYPDTVYYPYYKGVQMIEIDYANAWGREVDHHEGLQPRAMPWSAVIPKPLPNIYLMRDSTGHFVRAFNTAQSLSDLDKQFKGLPSSSVVTNNFFPVTHLLRAHFGNSYAYHLGRWKFHGYYLVHSVNPDHDASINNKNGIKTGMIDSLGNIVFPIIYDFVDEAGANFLVKKNNLFGIISKESDIILPFAYDEVNTQNEELIFLSSKKKISVVYENNNNKITQLDHYDWMDEERIDDIKLSRNEELARYGKNGKIGFINKHMVPVTPPIYDFTQVFFKNDLLLVNRNKKWGYINRKGKEVIPCRFEDAIDFEDGKAAVIWQGEKTCINTVGEIIEGCRFDYQKWETAESRGNISFIGNRQIIKRGYMEGLLDLQGNFILPIIYNNITGLEGFHPEISRWDQRCYKVKMGSKLGLIDKNGKEVLPAEYDQIQGFNGEMRVLMLEKNEKYGFLDSNYNSVAPCNYEAVDPYTWKGKIWYKEGKLWGVMNWDLSIFIKPSYEYHDWIHDGRIYVTTGNKAGVIDSTGRVIIPVKYKQLGAYFTNGLLMANLNGKWGFIDSTDHTIIPFEYEDVRRFTHAITAVKKEKYYYFIDRNNQRVNDANYDFVDHEWYVDRKVKVVRNKKIGWVDETGSESIPCIYDDENGYNQQGHHVRKGNEWMYVK